VRPDTTRAIDYKRYGDRLKSYGTAIRAGESTVVTLVKVKKDLIEFQLSGGGFGTFRDDSSSSVSIRVTSTRSSASSSPAHDRDGAPGTRSPCISQLASPSRTLLQQHSCSPQHASGRSVGRSSWREAREQQ